MVDTRIDGHVHTALCRHAVGTMEQYVKAAVSIELEGIVFLEHLECGVSYFERTWLTEDEFFAYRREVERLREQYRDRIKVLCGIEVGYNPRAIKDIRAFLDRHRWDRIGLSYHFYEVNGRHVNLVSRKQANLDAILAAGPARILEGYYRGLREAVEAIDGDVVCHLDAALRHVRGEWSFDPQLVIGRLLDTIAHRGMALEVNASGFAIRGEQFPGTSILRQAAARNIPLWAGSDAHRPEDVGRYFSRLGELDF